MPPKQSWQKVGYSYPILRAIYIVPLLLSIVARNALTALQVTTQIIQCKLTLQLASTVRYNTKKVVAF
jgi:hypothetical protein